MRTEKHVPATSDNEERASSIKRKPWDVIAVTNKLKAGLVVYRLLYSGGEEEKPLRRGTMKRSVNGNRGRGFSMT